MPLTPIQCELRALAQPDQALHASRFFKTGPGQYGEGDCFLGIKVPVLRALAKRHREMPLSELPSLLGSEYHEERLTGWLILLTHYQKARTDAVREQCIDFLRHHLSALNNWDLVDVIVPGTVGDWVLRRPEARQWLWDWIQSENLWERRTAVLATFAQIRQSQFALTLQLCEAQLKSGKPLHDLMQKANGWMLREIGKRDVAVLLCFLDIWATQMPRTMLRYAIEKLPEDQRQGYLRRR